MPFANGKMPYIGYRDDGSEKVSSPSRTPAPCLLNNDSR
jgi:hypothetical protein